MQIIYPTDGSKTARAALEFAVDIARSQAARIIVVSVAQVPEGPTEAIHGIEQMMVAFAGEYARQAAAEIRRRGLEAEERVETGRPADVILRIADETRAKVIVMGTHGRTGLARTIIGSVADRIIRHASCPVVLVPTREDL